MTTKSREVGANPSSAKMNSAMEGMENLPEEQRDALLQKIEELQVRDRFVPDAPGVAQKAAPPFSFCKITFALPDAV